MEAVYLHVVLFMSAHDNRQAEHRGTLAFSVNVTVSGANK